MASGRNGITRNHSVSRMSIPLDLPAVEAGGDADHRPITIAITVAATPTNRRDPRAPHELRPDAAPERSPCPGRYSRRRHPGIVASALIARRPSSSASSGATDRDEHEQHEHGHPGHARPVASAARARRPATARRRRVRAMRRGAGAAAAALIPARTARVEVPVEQIGEEVDDDQRRAEERGTGPGAWQVGPVDAPPRLRSRARARRTWSRW